MMRISYCVLRMDQTVDPDGIAEVSVTQVKYRINYLVQLIF